MGQYDAQIYSDLTSLGLNATAAAGVMGNMSQESSMNPGEAGGGLMQWIGSRWSALVSYANSRGLSPSSEKAQVGYFGKELAAGNEGITLQGLNAQPSPAAAALYVSQKYERPKASAANNPHRESEATRFYNEFSGSSASGGGVPDSSGDTIPGVTPTSASAQAPATPFPTGNDIIGIVDQSLAIKSFDIFHPVNSLTQDAGAISLRVVLVLIGLIFIIFALVAVVEKASGGAPAPIPIPV